MKRQNIIFLRSSLVKWKIYIDIWAHTKIGFFHIASGIELHFVFLRTKKTKPDFRYFFLSKRAILIIIFVFRNFEKMGICFSKKDDDDKSKVSLSDDL